MFVWEGLASLARKGFAGCVRDVLILKSSSPEAVWEPLDWDSHLEEHETYEDWEGCPAYSEHGAYFLGHGNARCLQNLQYIELFFIFYLYIILVRFFCMIMKIFEIFCIVISGFLKLEPTVFVGGDDFEISFEFKTDQLNSLLLFAYNTNGKDYIVVSFACVTDVSEFSPEK